MTDEQQKKFDSWSKLDIYEAYLAEHKARKQLNKQLNDTRREIAKMKYNIKQVLT